MIRGNKQSCDCIVDIGTLIHGFNIKILIFDDCRYDLRIKPDCEVLLAIGPHDRNFFPPVLGEKIPFARNVGTFRRFLAARGDTIRVPGRTECFHYYILSFHTLIIHGAKISFRPTQGVNFSPRHHSALPEADGNAIVAVLLYPALLLKGCDAVSIAGVFTKVEHLLTHSAEVAGQVVVEISFLFRRIAVGRQRRTDGDQRFLYYVIGIK